MNLYRIFFLAVNITLFSCAIPEQGSLRQIEIDRANFGEKSHFYVIESRPVWARFNSIAQCRFSEDELYLDFSKLSQSFNLSYSQMISMQMNLNQKISQKYDKGRDLEDIFFNVLTETENRDHPMSHFKGEIALIWVDPFVNQSPQWWEKKINGPAFFQLRPVFISLCLNSGDLEKKLKGVLGTSWVGGLDVLGKEALSVYALKGVEEKQSIETARNYELGSEQILDLRPFFKNADRVFVYSFSKHPISFLRGYHEVRVWDKVNP